MRTARRKSHATRSPSATRLPSSHPDALPQRSSSAASSSSSSSTSVHNEGPATFGSPALQSLIYATTNDRFPGAPGTLLHRAKLEAARALAAKQREAQREAERREEMKRLGILGVGKKRSTANANGRFNTPPASDRARRSNAANASSSTTTTTNSTTSSTINGTSTRPARSNGRNIASGAIDHTTLPVPVSERLQQQQQQQQQQQNESNGAGSPLLSASGRLRRPATGSRATSPMPLTGNSATGMTTRTRSPVVPPLELDADENA